MIRKPKKHPEYGISLVGINFGERWNVVQYATKGELETYISNYKHIKDQKNDLGQTWWIRRNNTINETTQNIYMRKTWRKRHSEAFQQDKLYRLDKNVARWSTKLGPTEGEGIATAWYFDRHQTQKLQKGDIVMLTKVDEMGNLYFAKADQIDAKHPFVFNRDNAQLSYVVPLDS